MVRRIILRQPVSGFTEFVATETSGEGTSSGVATDKTQKIYVSSSTGNDSNLGTLASPKLTIAGGYAGLRDGSPDWLLLKAGDTWTDESALQIKKSGVSAAEPMLIGAYGTGARPKIKTTGGVFFTSGAGGGGSKGDYFAIAGLEFHSYTRDSNDPGFIGAQDSSGTAYTAISWLNPLNWLLIEDCKFSYYTYGLTCQLGTMQSLNVRRNIFYQQYGGIVGTPSRSSAIYMDRIITSLIEENVFDHNGWDGALGSSSATIFNHGLYFQGIRDPGDLSTLSGPSVVRGNIFANNSAAGSQFRGGGTMYNNLFTENGYGHNVGAPEAGKTHLVSYNVHLNQVDHGSGSIPATIGTMDTYVGDDYDLSPITIDRNVIANSSIGGSIDIASGQTNAVVTNNVIYNVASGITDGGTGTTKPTYPTANGNKIDVNGDDSEGYAFPFPSRSVGSYAGTIGLTATLAAFLTACRGRAAGTWDSNLTAARVNNYIRVGFGMSEI